MDRPLSTGPLARCEVENTLTVQGRSLPMEQPTSVNICYRCELAATNVRGENERMLIGAIMAGSFSLQE